LPFAPPDGGVKVTELALNVNELAVNVNEIALRLRRTCSDNDTYKQRRRELMDYLVNRGYELNFLNTQMRRASDISRNDDLKPKPKQQTDTVSFVIIYNFASPNISRIIHKHSNVSLFIWSL